MLCSTCQQSWKTQQRPQTDKGQCSFQTQTRAMPKNAQSSSVQWLSHVQLFATPWTAACQASPFITNSWSLCKLMSIELVMPSNHLILCHPLLLPLSIFPSFRVFFNESVLRIRWPKNVQTTKKLCSLTCQQGNAPNPGS